MYKKNKLAEDNKTRYDLLAPFYRKHSDKRKNYLNSIDNLIINNIPENANNILDVGAGDGNRAMKIGNLSNISNIVLCEPDPSMVELCKKHKVLDIWNNDAENLFNNDMKFDVILCLWNVIGHINTNDKRIIALNNMGNLLTDNGLLFIDFSNRYNASYYGYLNTIIRYIFDFIHRSESNGDACFFLKYDENRIKINTHFFTLKEINNLINNSELSIKNFFIVDYKSGKLVKKITSGNLFYILSKRNSENNINSFY